MTKSVPPFWKTKTLEQMSEEEWESLCDGCGKCCLNKVEDEEDGSFHYTNIACFMLDLSTCRCKDYANRMEHVPTCVKIDPQGARTYRWLPYTCAYRQLAEGRSLEPWHPLLSGDPNSVHEAGISVKGRITWTDDVKDPNTMKPGKLMRHIISWPWGKRLERIERG
jgi:uncharacterized protein